MTKPAEFTHAAFLAEHGPLGPQKFHSPGGGHGVIWRAFSGGHMTQTDRGLLLWFGAAFGDQIYGDDPRMPAINVTKARDILAQPSTKASPQRIPLTGDLFNAIPRPDLAAAAAQMTIQQRNDPVIAIQAADTTAVIDGFERMLRRFQDGLDFVRMITLSENALPLIEVDVFRMEGAIWKRTSPLEESRRVTNLLPAV